MAVLARRNYFTGGWIRYKLDAARENLNCLDKCGSAIDLMRVSNKYPLARYALGSNSDSATHFKEAIRTIATNLLRMSIRETSHNAKAEVEIIPAD